MSLSRPATAAFNVPTDARVALIAARFNAAFVDDLLRGATERLTEIGIDGERQIIFRVPGAFELPLAAKLTAQTRRYAAVICLGCVIRGETAHFDFVAGEAARGIQSAALETGVPIIFGVLTTENDAQTRDRLGGAQGHAGRSAADAAAEMISLVRALAGDH